LLLVCAPPDRRCGCPSACASGRQLSQPCSRSGHQHQTRCRYSITEQRQKHSWSDAGDSASTVSSSLAFGPPAPNLLQHEGEDIECKTKAGQVQATGQAQPWPSSLNTVSSAAVLSRQLESSAAVFFKVTQRNQWACPWLPTSHTSPHVRGSTQYEGAPLHPLAHQHHA
jgi:hypothetical protein